MMRIPPRRLALVSVLVFSLVGLQAPSATALPLFSDGFESGNLSNWTGSAGVQVQSAVTFAGTFAARATTTGAAAYGMKQLTSSRSDLFMDTRVRVASVGGTTTLLRFSTSADKKVLSLSVKQNGALQIKNHITGVTDTSSTILPSASWRELQLRGVVNGASGLAEVWLDGSPVADISGTQELGSTGFGRVEIGSNQSSSGFDVVFDDVQVDTAFIGGGGEPPATPTGLRTTSVSATRVDLAWTASPEATSYRIYRDGPQVGSAGTAVFQDTNVDPETTYSYTVDACNASGCSAPTAPLPVSTPPESSGGTVVLAAGDIACDPADSSFNNGNGTSTRCRQKFTAQLLSAADAVFALGDVQYECAGLSAFSQSYNPTWGQYKSITFPAVGDEVYLRSGTGCGSPGNEGYFAYFGAASHAESDGYYSFDLGGWHVIVLNSECGSVDRGNAADGCAEGSPQNDWLEADLAVNSEACTLAFMHKRRFSSRKNGEQTDPKMKPFWDDLYAARADVILGGHSHSYERFESQNPSGQADPNGIVQFIVGTGGKSHGGLADPAGRLPTSETGTSKNFGLLKLTLNPSSYDWKYIVESGSAFSDSGTGNCV